MRLCRMLLNGLLLGGLLGCGGASSSLPPVVPTPPQGAARLSYTDPVGTGWRLMKSGGTGTSADPLLLELRGPSATRVKGVAFFLELGTGASATWATLGANTCILPVPNMDLGAEPRFLKDRLTANELQVALCQKSGDADPSLGVVKVGLSLKPNATVGELPLLQQAAKAAVLNGDGSITTPVAIQLGVLRAE